MRNSYLTHLKLSTQSPIKMETPNSCQLHRTLTQCSNYMEARVCRAPLLVLTAPSLCKKIAPPRGLGLGPLTSSQWITNISQNFLLMDNKHRKLFVIKQSKWCKFKPKMHQNTFGGRASPGHDGGAYAPPEPLSAIRGRKGGERGRKGRGREFPPPEVSVSRIDINHESYVGVVSAVVACLSVTSSHAVTSWYNCVDFFVWVIEKVQGGRLGTQWHTVGYSYEYKHDGKIGGLNVQLTTRAFQFAIRIDSFCKKNRPFDSLVVMQFLH